jgi:hypothetical protein
MKSQFKAKDLGLTCPSSRNWNKEWADLKEHQVHLVGLY